MKEKTERRIKRYKINMQVQDGTGSGSFLLFDREEYKDIVRIVTIDRKVENLLADHENKEWVSISVELCRGIYTFKSYLLHHSSILFICI
ncbi:hypothetical protein CTI12_AA410010 [Artemisia annua]|uniref:Uncharacterized protein n=1 Tax=Artemisia annua TaxID=35608 RepID=A0A2U1M782_ARTAN|nr:hypothetical protein CTI12_AA410010 [Artemisia annua]